MKRQRVTSVFFARTKSPDGMVFSCKELICSTGRRFCALNLSDGRVVLCKGIAGREDMLLCNQNAGRREGAHCTGNARSPGFLAHDMRL